LRGAFAIVQMSLAMVLLIGAGLMLKSLEKLLHVDGGFRTESVVSAELDLESARYEKDPAVIGFWQQTLDRVRVLPGITRAAIATDIPLTDYHSRTDISFEGMPAPANGAYPHPDLHEVSAGYLDTLRISLLRGRDIADSDTATSALVGLINNRLAQQYFAGQDPVGKRFMFGRPKPGVAPKWWTIVGVVEDTKLYGLANPSRYEVYRSYQQADSSDMNILLRSGSDPATVIPQIRQAVAGVDSTQALFNVETMSQMLSDNTSDRRSTVVLLASFSGLALLLAAIGIYGVLSYSTSRRTQEIGVRMALGAQRGDVLRLVLGECAWLVGISVAAGVAAAFGLTRLLSGLLFGVSSSDPVTFALATGILVIVAFMACWIPARRAIKVDPMVALRYE
jgi:putative ABC transport system permease protein